MKNWRESVELVAGEKYRNYLGEDEDGNLLAPSRKIPDWWDRRFNPKNPLHWPYWLRSRITKQLVMLETY